jgi:hypothetical protein
MWLTPAVKAVDTETGLEPEVGAEPEPEPEPGAGAEPELDPGCPAPQPIVTKMNAIMLTRNDFLMWVSSADTRARSGHTSGVEEEHPESCLGEIL